MQFLVFQLNGPDTVKEYCFPAWWKRIAFVFCLYLNNKKSISQNERCVLGVKGYVDLL